MPDMLANGAEAMSDLLVMWAICGPLIGFGIGVAAERYQRNKYGF